MSVASENQPEPRSDLPLLYANWARAVPGPTELALDLGYGPQGTEPEPSVRVVMTWENVKLLEMILARVIEQREANVGEIKLPAEVSLSAKETQS